MKTRGGSIIFTTGKKILLLKRSNESHSPGKWDLPGGRAENGEQATQAAIRETKEEVGKIEGKIFYEFVAETKESQWSTLFYKVKNTFSCQISHEHQDWKWVNIDKVKSYDLHFKLKQYWKQYKRAIEEHF